MKKTICGFLFLCTNFIFSQEIGIRMGNFDNSKVAIDGIVNFSDATRLHGDVTIGNGIGAHLLYDFKVATIDKKNYFQYYLGTGIGTFIGEPFVIGVNGEAGIEVVFKDIPVTLGVDWRPQLNILAKTTLVTDQIGLNLRYRINEL